MKKTFTFLLNILCLNAFSQLTSDVRGRIDGIFREINKSQVPTGFLEEFGIPLVPLDVFNGTISDSNRIDINPWREIYATLHSSRIYGTNPLSDIETVNATIATAETNNSVIPVPLLYANYNYIRPDAVEENLLRVVFGVLRDVPGRSASPYYSRQLFAAAPAKGYTRSGQFH